ncbi:hypothetical protein EI94DRAFT_1717706 [Lactarius quietus]|nr:hypothetical protein EI94DRAFT_1717706 [Lactarius quietus]
MSSLFILFGLASVQICVSKRLKDLLGPNRPNHLVNLGPHEPLCWLCIICFESLITIALPPSVQGHKLHVPIQGSSYLISRSQNQT